jgi:hypothetical protein
MLEDASELLERSEGGAAACSSSSSMRTGKSRGVPRSVGLARVPVDRADPKCVYTASELAEGAGGVVTVAVASSTGSSSLTSPPGVTVVSANAAPDWGESTSRCVPIVPRKLAEDAAEATSVAVASSAASSPLNPSLPMGVVVTPAGAGAATLKIGGCTLSPAAAKMSGWSTRRESCPTRSSMMLPAECSSGAAEVIFAASCQRCARTARELGRWSARPS